MKMAFSGASLIRFLMTYTNCDPLNFRSRNDFRSGKLTWPTVRSAGTRYFFLSMLGMSVLSAFSQITYFP